jgi:tripartite-type tricarboxylate transporter receptor subunit TctC
MTFKSILAGLALFCVAFTAAAQYPDRPVKIINPFSVGGSGDAVQRLIATKLTESTGKTFIVDNKVGATGRIGYDFVAKSAPDGYTLVAGDATYTILPGLYGKLPWDPARDLIPITVYARTPFVLVVRPNARFKTFKDMVQYAKANPGKVTFGSAGTGSINQLVMEVVAREAHVTLSHVPYKGMGEALNGLLSGSVDVIATGVPTAIGQIKGGKLVPLALTAEKRWPATPDVPTLHEVGVNYATYSWMGLMSPNGTPQHVVDYLYQNIQKVLQDPSTRSALDAQGFEASGMPTAEFARMLRDDTKRWTEVIRTSKITAE